MKSIRPLTWFRGAVVCAALCAGMAAPALADRAGFSIRSFHTDLFVQEDSDLIVEEHIQVDFSERRHGIYRMIPVRYTDPRGFEYSFGFRMLGVSDQRGRKHKTKVTRSGQYVKIRIGDAKRTELGLVEYALRYRIRGGVSHFPEHDELYWNATGEEWNTALAEVSAAVHLPGPVEPSAMEVAGYTGRMRSREQDVRIGHPKPGSVLYVVTRPLRPLEGLTVVATWPHGLVDFPGPVDRGSRFVGDNAIVLVPLLALGGLWRRYQRRGRDPEGPAAVMIRYEPPEGLAPAEVGTLVDERVDLKDITATVVNLAVRGYLTIEVQEEETMFGLSSKQTTTFEKKKGKSHLELAPHEQRVMEGLFESGDRVSEADLENEFYKHVPEIKDALYSRLLKKGYFDGHPQRVRRRTMLAGLAAGIVTFAAGLLLAKFRGGVMPQALVLPVVAGLATLLAFALFARAMPRRTKKGVEARAWALGFEEFVYRVEKDKLEHDRARNVFESLLPYAMALGVAGAWAKQFEGIYEAAGETGPSWYRGPRTNGRFTTSGFQQSLASAMSRTGSEMTSSPRSSGSSGAGGGGSSGGGGGGGGGGSW